MAESIKKSDIENEYYANKTLKIVRKMILGFIIIILLIHLLFDTGILIQTIIASSYTETTITYVDKKDSMSIYDRYIYSFENDEGKKQEIIVSIPKGDVVEQEIRIRYNKKNPQKYYTESATFNTSEIIFYIVKLIITVALIFRLFDKSLLNKITTLFRVPFPWNQNN